MFVSFEWRKNGVSVQEHIHTERILCGISNFTVFSPACFCQFSLYNSVKNTMFRSPNEMKNVRGDSQYRRQEYFSPNSTRVQTRGKLSMSTSINKFRPHSNLAAENDQKSSKAFTDIITKFSPPRKKKELGENFARDWFAIWNIEKSEKSRGSEQQNAGKWIREGICSSSGEERFR